MVKKKDLKKQYDLPKWFWVVVALVAVVIIVFVGALLVNRTGWPGYLQALNKCDGKPPVQASSFITASYIAPGDEKYRIPGDKGFTTVYYCTEAEAQAAGYKHFDF